MKTYPLVTIICGFIAAFFWYSIAAGTTDKQESTTGAPASDTTAYSVPKEKEDRWESIRAQLQKEKNICKEHCGNEAVCLERCRQVYKSRLDREYKQLLHQ